MVDRAVELPAKNFTDWSEPVFSSKGEMPMDGVPQWVLSTAWGPPSGVFAKAMRFQEDSSPVCNSSRSFDLSEVLNKSIRGNGTLDYEHLSFDALFIGGHPHHIDGDHIESCVAAPRSLEEKGVIRTTVDARYANWPRCCVTEELNDLELMDGGGLGVQAEEAEKQFKKVKVSSDVSYIRVDPTAKSCSSSSQCPLVVALPGAAGNPWFLYQIACPACAKSLTSVAISPVDIVSVPATIMPSVDHALKGGDIDESRVYLVSTSKGNEYALRAALFHADVFTMVVMIGEFSWGEATSNYDLNADVVAGMINVPHRRLKSLQFHVGDNDVKEGPAWWDGLTSLLKLFPSSFQRDPMVDLHIYVQAEHPAWFATWNALHEVLWVGTKNVDDEFLSKVPVTCHSRH